MTAKELEAALRAYFKSHFPHAHARIELYPSGGSLVIEQCEDCGAQEDSFQSTCWNSYLGETFDTAVQRIKDNP